MIDRQGGKLVFECDSCDTVEEFPNEEDGFSPAWETLKRDGWKARKIGKDWVHGCPKCGV